MPAVERAGMIGTRAARRCDRSRCSMAGSRRVPAGVIARKTTRAFSIASTACATMPCERFAYTGMPPNQRISQPSGG